MAEDPSNVNGDDAVETNQLSGDSKPEVKPMSEIQNGTSGNVAAANDTDTDEVVKDTAADLADDASQVGEANEAAVQQVIGEETNTDEPDNGIGVGKDITDASVQESGTIAEARKVVANNEEALANCSTSESGNIELKNTKPELANSIHSDTSLENSGVLNNSALLDSTGLLSTGQDSEDSPVDMNDSLQNTGSSELNAENSDRAEGIGASANDEDEVVESDEEMSDLFNAYKNVLEEETADDCNDPLNTSIVTRMDAIDENEEGEDITETRIPDFKIRKFTDSGGSIKTDSEESSEPRTDDSSMKESSDKTDDLGGTGPRTFGTLCTEELLKPQPVMASLMTQEPIVEKEDSEGHDSPDDEPDGESNKSSGEKEKKEPQKHEEKQESQKREEKVESQKREEKPILKYPEFIEECSKKLKQHYVSTYAKETPCHWFKGEKNPQHRIFNDFFLTSKQLRETVTNRLDDVIIQQGHRVLIVGDSGYGKTCLTHKILHDYGLNLLPSCTRYKILLAVDVTLWSRDLSIDDVIKNHIFKESLDMDDKVIEWIKSNSQAVLFVIDGIDRHFDSQEHPIMDLLNGVVYQKSTVLFLSRPRGITAIKDKCQSIHYIEKLSDTQIQDFVAKFFEGNIGVLETLSVSLQKDYHEHYRIPLNLSLLCRLAENGIIKPGDAELPQSQTELFQHLFLYTLHRLQGDSSRQVNELAFSITELALSTIQEQTFNLSEENLKSHGIDKDLRENLVSNGLLEKVACQDLYYFPYRLYQEFLAAKHIALKYFKQLNSEQVGVVENTQKDELEKLFQTCWACDQRDYRFDKICVFLSGLLNNDCHRFVQALTETVRSIKNPEDRNRCRDVTYACIRENHQNKNFVGILADCVSQTHDMEMNEENSDFVLQGISGLLYADKLTSLTISNCASDIGFPRLCESIQKSNRLQDLRINFDGFDQHQNLANLTKAVMNCSSLKNLVLTVNIDEISLETTNSISNIFINLNSSLRSLGVHLMLRSDGITYAEDRPTVAENLDVFEKINIFLSRMTVFLKNNPTVEHLDLKGCFLHKDALPEISEALISHPNLKSLEVAGQKHGAPLHREGVVALSEILGNKQFEQVAIDLNSFSGDLKQSNREGKKWVRFEGYTNELIMTRLLKAMQENVNLRKVRFTCKGFDSDLVDLVSDFIESCSSLKEVEFECTELDDLLLLFLGCGILCSLSVENVVLKGAVKTGAAVVQLFQTCLISLSVKELIIDCSPITTECLEWLVDNLPDLVVPSSHPVRVVLKGRTEDAKSELLEQLSECAMPLDLLLEVELSD